MSNGEAASRASIGAIMASTSNAAVVAACLLAVGVPFTAAVAQGTAVGSPVVATVGTPVVATAIGVGSDRNRTDVTIDLTQGVTAEAFTLANPYRVVIDLPGVAFQVSGGDSVRPGGLVKAIRHGAFADGRGRVVIDTSGPVAIARASMDSRNEGGVRLTLALSPMQPAEFGNGTGSARARVPSAAVKPAVFDDTAGAVPRSKPRVMIDPGHGGIDPGAIGAGKISEKVVVLAVALQLRSALLANGRYDVQMTRADDTFVPLDRRVTMAGQAKADLFISLHADAVDDPATGKGIRGASVYTLSERASDEQARAMADKENAADLAAGIDQIPSVERDDVKNILFELTARETAVFSHLLSRSVVTQLGKSGSLARQPERAAAFRVLKQPHAPSILIELGFLSHPAEELQLASPQWQRQVARGLAAAVDTYFVMKSSSIAAGASIGAEALDQSGVLP